MGGSDATRVASAISSKGSISDWAWVDTERDDPIQPGPAQTGKSSEPEHDAALVLLGNAQT